jgi:hypothetical protein
MTYEEELEYIKPARKGYYKLQRSKLSAYDHIVLLHISGQKILDAKKYNDLLVYLQAWRDIDKGILPDKTALDGFVYEDHRTWYLPFELEPGYEPYVAPATETYPEYSEDTLT